MSPERKEKMRQRFQERRENRSGGHEKRSGGNRSWREGRDDDAPKARQAGRPHGRERRNANR